MTVAWNPILAPDVTGYRVYYGQTSRTYSAHVDVTNSSATIFGLFAGTTYFFAVTATAAGLESPFSTEIRYTVPPASTVLLQVSPAHGAMLSGSATPGYQFQVWATEDLRNWVSIGSLTVDSRGSFKFIDWYTATNSRRFYRLQQTSPQPPASSHPYFVPKTPVLNRID